MIQEQKTEDFILELTTEKGKNRRVLGMIWKATWINKKVTYDKDPLVAIINTGICNDKIRAIAIAKECGYNF